MYFSLSFVRYRTDNSFISSTFFIYKIVTPLFLLTVFLNIVADQSLNKRMEQQERFLKKLLMFFSVVFACVHHHY
jgi:hypothetical protein